MRTHIETGLQVVGVANHGHHLKAPVVQAKEDAETIVVDTSLLRAVHGGESPFVVALDGVGRMVP